MTEEFGADIIPLAAVLGTQDVADLLGVHRQTVGRLVAGGSLPGHRVPGGRQWVFRTDEVLRAISSWGDGSGEGDSRADACPPASASDRSVKASEVEAGARADPIDVWCAAPARTDDQTDDEWVLDCLASWVAAASRSGIAVEAKENDGSVRVAGRIYELCVAPRETVEVVDDLGEAQHELIETVWVERR